MARGDNLSAKFNFFPVRKINLISVIFLLYLILPIFNSQAQEIANKASWILWKENAHSQVHYRKTNHQNLIEIKSTSQVNSSLSAFLIFLQDPKNTPQWLDNVKQCEVLQTIDNYNHIFKTEFKGFWPIKSREMIVHSRYWQNKDLSLGIEIKDIVEENNGSTDKSKSIKIKVLSAHWLITPISDNRISIEYAFIVDVRGSIPQWLVNNMMLKSIWKTLANIQQQLPLDKWQQQSLPFIKEKI